MESDNVYDLMCSWICFLTIQEVLVFLGQMALMMPFDLLTPRHCRAGILKNLGGEKFVYRFGGNSRRWRIYAISLLS